MDSQKPILIWDWDGTLVDTIEYKYDGIWDDIFPDDEKKQKAVKEFLHSLEGKGVNRFGLIKHALVFTDRPDLADMSDDELKQDSDITKYSALYKKFSEESAVKKGIYPGTKEVLEKLFNGGYSMYIISGGGSDDDLKQMAEDVGIGGYFKKIFGFGSPGSSLTSFDKKANFERIMSQEGERDSDKYIVIGDSLSDYKFAESVGAKFIGFVREWNKWGGYKNELLLVDDIKSVESSLKGLI